MADMNRGLDLSDFETTSDAESDQFRVRYLVVLGSGAAGLAAAVTFGQVAGKSVLSDNGGSA